MGNDKHIDYSLQQKVAYFDSLRPSDAYMRQ